MVFGLKNNQWQQGGTETHRYEAGDDNLGVVGSVK